jgi:hypothetical protein
VIEEVLCARHRNEAVSAELLQDDLRDVHLIGFPWLAGTAPGMGEI